jgi:hypothetical protein
LYDFFANVKPKPSYRFAAGASGFAKRRAQQQQQQQKGMSMTDAYCGHQVGEDAYFVRHDALSVGDGVGGWINTEGNI